MLQSIKQPGVIGLVLLTFLISARCGHDETSESESGEHIVTIKTEEVINDSYIGNGVQWDPYPQAYKYWGLPISNADWEKMYERLDYMRPSFMRVVIGSYDKYANRGPDEYHPEDFFEGLDKILSYCQNQNITVMLGDWGYNQVDPSNNQIIENRLDHAAEYLRFLIEDKGFTCIKYYNIINEPNLQGSAANGNYEVWKNATQYFFQRIEALGVSEQVKIAGPDIAWFSQGDTSWITRTVSDLPSEVSFYEVHTYPPLEAMFNGTYESTLKEMKDAIPEQAPIVIGEFGLKYETGSSRMDKTRHDANIKNIEADPNIAYDSNTLVEEVTHGVDLMALVIKIMNAGYSGAVNWGMDDAMHSGSTEGTDLKVWGHWNILGEELLGEISKENTRPHFYAYSLISRYTPQGARILKVNKSNLPGLDVLVVEKDGQYMIAINNIHELENSFELQFDTDIELSGMKKFIFSEDERPVDTNGYPIPTEDNFIFNTTSTHLVIPSKTLYVITNFNY